MSSSQQETYWIGWVIAVCCAVGIPYAKKTFHSQPARYSSPTISTDSPLYPSWERAQERLSAFTSWGTDLEEEFQEGFGFSWKGDKKEVAVYPTYPGTNMRDFSSPGIKMERDSSGNLLAYPTLPGSNCRDFSQAGIKIEENRNGNLFIYPTYPGTRSRDFSKPGLRIEKDRKGNVSIYPTYPGMGIRDFSKPGIRIEVK